MKKLFAVFALIMSMLYCGYGQEKVTPVSGGTGRTAALGGGPYNPYILDYTDVFINPAYAAQYNSLLYSDVGYGFTAFNATGQYVGYTMSMSDLAIGGRSAKAALRKRNKDHATLFTRQSRSRSLD